jgi:hypothetical protein
MKLRVLDILWRQKKIKNKGRDRQCKNNREEEG